MKCLVVDDSATMRRIVINALKTIGYSDAVEAADGREAVTTRSLKEDILQALDAGINSYILKPFTPQVLKAMNDETFRSGRSPVRCPS